jgi:hypothetical protein
MNDRTKMAFGFARELLRADLAQRMLPDGIDLAKQATEYADSLLELLDNDSPGPAVEVASASPTSKAPPPAPGEVVSRAFWVGSVDHPNAAIHLVSVVDTGRRAVLSDQSVCGAERDPHCTLVVAECPRGQYCEDCLHSEHPDAQQLLRQIEALR